MKITRIVLITIAAFLAMTGEMSAQQSVVDAINKYGKFDQWSRRQVKESAVIGGNDEYLYEFYGNYGTKVTGKTPFVAPKGYLWRTNNVLAVVAGIVKASNSVFPEKRGNGYCARIETRMEEVKAIGIVEMDVVSQGVLMLGTLPEPITTTKNPMSKVQYGIPFTGKPKCIRFDMKADVGYETIRATGFSRTQNLGKPDGAEITVILQKRWEDSSGNIHALRVGTGIERITKDIPSWLNSHEIEIHYGDITGEPFYKDYMGLKNNPSTAYHAINSKGKDVVIKEDGWAEAGTQPTHIVILFLSSCGEPFSGGVGNKLWIDNVEIVM